MEYAPQQIEKKWQAWWKANHTYRVTNDSAKPKYFILDMFPYPSGSGLHVGHPLGYIASDIIARYKRLQGFNVLHPMGFDAFGLPAEQYAIENGVHPSISTQENMQRYREQLNNLGFCYDWEREVNTSDPKYYKWTQWIFTQLFAHYYDTKSDKALPISQLVRVFEQSGNASIQAVTKQKEVFTAQAWAAMSAREQDDILMQYRLIFRTTGYVNWCDQLGSVLANDEVVNGVSERGGFPVEQREMVQWSMRITAYAERLLRGLDTVEYPSALMTTQRNWIGRSEGAQVFFDIKGSDQKLEIYTTRPDTIFGASFMVIAPEHDLVETITTPSQRAAIDTYLDYVQARSERDRISDVKTTTGAWTGAFAIHPFTGKDVPIWISEYVLKGYGTGAIMAVPADDERDHRFAEKFGLDVLPVIDKSKYPGASIEDKVGVMINSDFLNGLEVPDAIHQIITILENKAIGTRRINYKMRDANFSRQRYWGEPIPVIYDSNGVASTLGLESLPLELPKMDDIKPGGSTKGPLSKLTDWINMPNGNTRECDTMPGYAGSSWYYLRYMDPHNADALVSGEAIKYWRDIDFYIGGDEHAGGHLLYSRMWHKFLHDIGIVPTEEPYKKMVNQGKIQGVIQSICYHKTKKQFISAQIVDQYNSADIAEILVHADMVTDATHLTQEGIAAFRAWRSDYAETEFVFAEGDHRFMTRTETGKMSKSKYNVVNPDKVIEQYGADTLRMYEMFLGPVEASKPWDTKGITGVSGFLRRFHGLFTETALSNEPANADELRVLHTCIKKVTEDIERFSLNTCVSNFMVCTNDLRKLNCTKKAVLEPLVPLILPFAPHIAEELWQFLGHKTSVCDSAWPIFDETFLKVNEVTIPICINGKKRSEASFGVDVDPEWIKAEVLNMDVVKKWLEGQEPKKVIILPGKMVNIVV
jgi:leucyl-tRNA synthetase